MISHPFQRIPIGKLRFFLVPSSALTFVLVAAVLAMPGPGNLPSLVAAGTPARAQAILESWTELDRIHVAWKNGFDYFLMVAFSNTLALACVWASRQFAYQLLTGAGLLLAWLAWASILLDVPENVAYFSMIRGSLEQPWPALAAVCFSLKSAFQVLTSVYLLVALAVRLMGQRLAGTAKAAV
jgi:hypothetical protein